MTSDPKPRTPGAGWLEMPAWVAPLAPGCMRWVKHLGEGLHLTVVSSVNHSEPERPEWHVSVSLVSEQQRARPTDEQIALVLEATGMEGAEEDNGSGWDPRVRHFWKAVQ